MMPEPETPFSLDSAERLARLEALVSVLAQALDALDALEMHTPASHVSMGLELAKSDLEKLQNEANLE